MREIVHIQAGQCGNQIGAKVSVDFVFFFFHFPSRSVVTVFQAGHDRHDPIFFPHCTKIEVLTVRTRFSNKFKVIFVQFCFVNFV